MDEKAVIRRGGQEKGRISDEGEVLMSIMSLMSPEGGRRGKNADDGSRADDGVQHKWGNADEEVVLMRGRVLLKEDC